MKKFLSIIALAVLSISLAACTNNSSDQNTAELKNGEYTAQGTQDERGWTEFVKIEVKNNKISSVVFDSKKEDGSLKSEDVAYNQTYKEGTGGVTDAKTSYKELADQYIETKNISNVKKVSSATNSSNSFIKLVTALEPKLKEGNTALVVVDDTESK